jgi:adenylate kinase family enzyme
MRTVVIGNSGSGKTWLASQIAFHYGLPVTHLDDIFWDAGGFDKPRADIEVEKLVVQHFERQDWLIEGVFGALAAKFLPVAETLIWLDMPWEVCCSRLQRRGSEST